MARFWGTITAVRARLTLAKFEGETTPTCDGHYWIVEGTQTVGNNAPVAGTYIIAVGRATQEEKRAGVGDLVRGDAQPIPETNRDTYADLYRVGAVHVLARAKDRNIVRESDPPRTDSPLSPEAINLAPRRVLRPTNLTPGGDCASCPYGTTVGVVRLSDPRDYRRGIWSKVPACLGPTNCPYYAAP